MPIVGTCDDLRLPASTSLSSGETAGTGLAILEFPTHCETAHYSKIPAPNPSSDCVETCDRPEGCLCGPRGCWAC